MISFLQHPFCINIQKNHLFYLYLRAFFKKTNLKQGEKVSKKRHNNNDIINPPYLQVLARRDVSDKRIF